MNRKIWPLAVVLSLMVLQASEAQRFQHPSPPLAPDPAPQPSDLTVDQLIAKSNTARGGEQKLKSIQSAKMTGTWESSQGSSSSVTVLIAPGRYLRRIEQVSSRGPSVKAVDGETTWEITPQAGILKPKPMVPRDATRYRHLADPQGPLVDSQAKGNKVEVVGKQAWKGSQVYKLKVTFRQGGVNYLYLDAKSFLPVRLVSTLWVHPLNKEVAFELLFQDYRDLDGVKWPYKEVVNAPEVGFVQTTSWKAIEVNKPLDPAAFKAPKG